MTWALTEGEVLIGEARHPVGIEAEGMHHVISDVVLAHYVEIVVNHVVDVLELGSLDEEREEEDAVLLQAVVGLAQEGVLVCVVEEALDVDHEVDGETGDGLGQALHVGHDEVTVDVAAVRPVRSAELDVPAR